MIKITTTFDDWETIRKRGKYRFFAVNGVLAYGLPMFVFLAFITKPFADGFSSHAAIVHYYSCPIAGLLFGITMWYYYEYKYRKERAEKIASKGPY